MRSNRSILSDEVKLKEWVKNSLSKAHVLRKAELAPKGGNYKALTKYIELYDIDISHFTGQGWNVGLRYKPIKQAIPLEEILVEGKYYNSDSLRKRLIKEGLKTATCEICKNSTWNDKNIPLELDHINGVNIDNRICNLRIICPNCHAQTPTYRGKQKKMSARREIDEVEFRKFGETSALKDGGNPEPSLFKRKKEGVETLHGRPTFCSIDYCDNCKKVYQEKKHKTRFCSIECYRTIMASSIPSPGEILDAFEIHKNFLQVGKHFNVSDNAVRKWCKKYNITDRVKRKSRPQIEKI